MKRLVLFVLAITSMVGITFAQDKAHKGSWSTEVQINPFEQNGNTFSLDGLKVRYFFNDKDALRLKVSFYTRNDKNTDEDSEDNNNDYQKKYKNEYNYKTGNFSIDLGYERHFDLAKRLNAYLGGSIGFGKNFGSTKINNYSETETNYSGNNLTSTIKKTNLELKNGAIFYNDLFHDTNINPDQLFARAQRATFNINAAIFAGLEFYIYKGIYIGTELGIGYQSAKTLKMELDGKTTITTINRGNINKEETEIDEETTDNTRTSNFQTYIEPKLRIGITF